MSWKAALLTAGNKPPMIKASIVNNDMLKLQISPEIAKAIGLLPAVNFTAFIGTVGEHGQVKITADSNGKGKVKGSAFVPTVYIPAESSWESFEQESKCDFEIHETENSLIVNLPWFTGKAPEVMHGNQRLNSVVAVQMLERYRRGVGRRRLAELYKVSESTVFNYTNGPEDISAHNEAVRAARSVRDRLVEGPSTQVATVAGLRKPGTPR